MRTIDGNPISDRDRHLTPAKLPQARSGLSPTSHFEAILNVGKNAQSSMLNQLWGYMFVEAISFLLDRMPSYTIHASKSVVVVSCWPHSIARSDLEDSRWQPWAMAPHLRPRDEEKFPVYLR